MQLAKLPPLENIVTLPDNISRRELLIRLIQPLAKSGIVDGIDTFADDLEEREEQVTTQVEGGFALPHARSLAVRRLGLTMGIAPPPGLNFGPDPSQPCRIFFLIAIPEFAPAAHLPLLQTLAKMARDQKRREKLLACTTARQALKEIGSFKG